MRKPTEASTKAVAFTHRFIWSLPLNEHPMPIAEAFDGIRWTVDLSYRAGNIDIETTSVHRDLDKARDNAFLNIKRLLGAI